MQAQSRAGIAAAVYEFEDAGIAAFPFNADADRNFQRLADRRAVGPENSVSPERAALMARLDGGRIIPGQWRSAVSRNFQPVPRSEGIGCLDHFEPERPGPAIIAAVTIVRPDFIRSLRQAGGQVECHAVGFHLHDAQGLRGDRRSGIPWPQIDIPGLASVQVREIAAKDAGVHTRRGAIGPNPPGFSIIDAYRTPRTVAVLHPQHKRPVGSSDGRLDSRRPGTGLQERNGVPMCILCRCL